MKIYTVIIINIIVVVLFSCKQNSDRQKNDQSSENLTMNLKRSTIDFVNTYEGQINNKYDFLMKITSKSGNISGKYFYKKYGKNIEINGTIDKNLNVRISEFDANGNQTGLFKGRMLNENKIEGTWSKPNGSNAMPFSLLLTKSNYEISQKEITKYNNITGHFVRDRNRTLAELEIEYIGNDRVHVIGFAQWSNTKDGIPNIGNLDFKVQLTDGKILFTDKLWDNKKYQLEIHFTENGLKVIEQSIIGYFGMNVTFHGVYEKINN